MTLLPLLSSLIKSPSLYPLHLCFHDFAPSMFPSHPCHLFESFPPFQSQLNWSLYKANQLMRKSHLSLYIACTQYASSESIPVLYSLPTKSFRAEARGSVGVPVCSELEVKVKFFLFSLLGLGRRESYSFCWL